MPILKILSNKLQKLNKSELSNMIRVVELEDPKVIGNPYQTALAITAYFNVKCSMENILEYEKLHIDTDISKNVIYGNIY